MVPSEKVKTINPDRVSKSWLTARLQDCGAAAKSATVTGFTAQPIGAGKMGDTFRYQLTWGGPPGPATVVGKFASADQESRAAALRTGIYQREINFFSELASHVDIRIPNCHYCKMNASTGEFVVLMEDLAPATVGDQITGCSPDEANAALEELVGLHGVEIPGLASRDWLGSKCPEAAENMGLMYSTLLPTFLERYADRLSSETIRVAERFGGCAKKWLTMSSAPYRLLHGDYRLDNLMIGPEGVTAVDWQTVCYGPPVSDVSYFCGAGLLTDDRRAHEEGLVRSYHERLEHRSGGLISWDRCWADYRLHAVAGLHMAVVAAAMVTEDERGVALFSAMAERHAAHVVDLETLDLLESCG